MNTKYSTARIWRKEDAVDGSFYAEWWRQRSVGVDQLSDQQGEIAPDADVNTKRRANGVKKNRPSAMRKEEKEMKVSPNYSAVAAFLMYSVDFIQENIFKKTSNGT